MRIWLACTCFFMISIVFFDGSQASTAGHPATSQVAAPQAEMTHILFIGDSLTAGYGVHKNEAFPAVVERRLKQKGYAVKITNGGISGSVTAEADKRLRWFLKTKPRILFLALGANDALKGTPPAVIKANLKKVIVMAQENDIQVVLGGVRIFTNFGAAYATEFEKVYSDLAREHKVVFIPFILEGVALDKSLNLADGKHPNAKGHERVAENVMRVLEPLL